MSGSGTNSGIDYQQRVSAWFLIALLQGFDITEFVVDLPDSLKVREVAFETNTPIDDLQINFHNGNKAYLQIKRSLALSDQNQSDFYKTIEQFVSEYSEKPNSQDIYIITTSSDTSPKIKKDLRKIFESMRLNDQGFSQNPLNKSEINTVETYTNVVKSLFHAHEITYSNEELVKFSKKIYILIFDIGTAMPDEKVALTLLRNSSIVNPRLIWATLIQKCLYYATQRLSVDKNGIQNELRDYLLSEKDNKRSMEISQNNFFKVQMGGGIPVRQEILFIESFIDDNFMLVELDKFNPDCTKRAKFHSHNKCTIKSGMTWTVIQRFASISGVERYIEKINEQMGDKEILIISGPPPEEESICYELHSDKCEKIIEQNKNIFSCLHCGKAVSEAISELVEIDDVEHEHTIGLVHAECLQPLDRILGYVRSSLFEEFSFLKKFDMERWAKLIQHGQGMFNSLKENTSLTNREMAIGWEFPMEYNPSYKYCIQHELSDGSAKYVTARGKVERMSKKKAFATAEFLNESIVRARENNDPFCYTTKTGIFGRYSSITSEDDECIECLNAKAVPYDDLIGTIYNQNVDYYAPVCLLVNEETEELFAINNHVVMITDPFDLDRFIRNWEKAKLSPKPYEIAIIPHDHDFDIRVRGLFDLGKEVIVNPLVSLNGEFLKGLVIRDLKTMLPEEAHQLL